MNLTITHKHSFIISIFSIFLLCLGLLGCRSDFSKNKNYAQFLTDKFVRISKENIGGIKKMNSADIKIFAEQKLIFKQLRDSIINSSSEAEENDPILDEYKVVLIQYAEENIALWEKCLSMASVSSLLRGLFYFKIPEEVQNQIDIVTKSMETVGDVLGKVVVKYDIDI